MIIISGIITRLLSPPGVSRLFAFVLTVLGAGIFYMTYRLWFGANWARLGFMLIYIICVPVNTEQLLFGSTAKTNPLQSLLGIALAICFIIALNSREAKQFCTL